MGKPSSVANSSATMNHPAVLQRAGAALRLAATATASRDGSTPEVRVKGREPRRAVPGGK